MRNFIDIIKESVILSERHSYATMTDGLINAFARFDIDIKGSWIVTTFEEEMKWAREKLKREDRIVWYLRRARMELIKRVYISEGMRGLSLGGGPVEPTPLQAALTALWNDEQKRWQQTMGYAYDPSPLGGGGLAHYVAMAPQIEGIRSYKWDRQSMAVLNRDLNGIESRWKKEQQEKSRYIDKGQDKTLISFPDGYEWVHLKRPYCEKEGKAMGHCGNKAAAKEGDTILSLRRPSDRRGYYHPVLTFILHKNGKLGEMKGRFNEKPESKYHPYIIELLRNPIVKGIKGGGYAPSRNFSLDDLREKDYAALVQYKPSLKK